MAQWLGGWTLSQALCVPTSDLCASTNNSRQVAYNQVASVTKQYNSVFCTAKSQRSSAAWR